MIIWLFTLYYITSLSVILSHYTNNNKIEDFCIENYSDDTCWLYDETELIHKNELGAEGKNELGGKDEPEGKNELGGKDEEGKNELGGKDEFILLKQEHITSTNEECY